MYEKICIRVDIPQFLKLRKKLQSGEASNWISEAICSLLLLDKSSPLELSFFIHGKKTKNPRCMVCWLSLKEASHLKSFVERMKKESRSFSRSIFVSEAIERRLLLFEEDRQSDKRNLIHLHTRIDPKIVATIKEPTNRRKSRKKQFISHWLGSAVEELLSNGSPVDPFLHQDTHWKESVITSVVLTPELKNKVKIAVKDLKKINQKFSISLFIKEAARRKLKRENLET